jgi:hypothetical protein
MRKTAGNVLEITRLCFFNEGMLEKHNVGRGGEGRGGGVRRRNAQPHHALSADRMETVSDSEG